MTSVRLAPMNITERGYEKTADRKTKHKWK